VHDFAYSGTSDDTTIRCFDFDSAPAPVERMPAREDGRSSKLKNCKKWVFIQLSETQME
jgi:hypothetical protein